MPAGYIFTPYLALRDWRYEEIKPIRYVGLILALRSVLGATC